jgi:hypothetical protein
MTDVLDTQMLPYAYLHPERAELYEEICLRLAEGETLVDICKSLHMPVDRTVRQWVLSDSGFAQAYAHARDVGFDKLASECLEIADDSTNDYMDKQLDNGKVIRVLDAEHVQRSKLRIETRLKLLAKWDPKRYGEKTTMDLNAVVEQKLPLPQLQAEIKRMLDKGVIDVDSQEVKP